MSRILLVHQPVDGGVGRHMRDLFQGLGELGHDPLLCGPGLPHGLPPDAAERHLRLEMGRSVSPRTDGAAVIQFARTVNRVRPDLIHAHSSKAGAVARLARVAHHRIPVLYTPHGFAFGGHFETEVERWSYRQVERLLAPLTTAIVAVCRAEAELAATVCPRGRVRVVHNGVEVGAPVRPDAAIRALADDGPVICVVTQLRPGKGVETAIDALPAVLERVQRAQLVVVGGGELAGALETRAAARGVRAQVRFLGARPDSLAVVRAADVVVMTSWAEALPYVVLEAMSLGMPIVASEVGGIPEAIVDGESGLLVPPGDTAATAAAIVSLLERPWLRRQLGSRAQERVTSQFSLQRMLQGLLGVYGEALVGRR